MNTNLEPGTVVKITFGKPHVDQWRNTTDLRPDLVGKTGYILKVRADKGFMIILDENEPGKIVTSYWMRASCIRPLKWWERLFRWLNESAL
jgi:hypothetical protein